MADKRLIDSDDLPLAQAMLSAAAAESTPGDVRRRALASLGLLVAAPTAAAALTASTAQAAAAGGQASSVAGSLSKALWYQAWYAKTALVVGMGGCALGAIYQADEFVHGRVDDVLPVDVWIPGCPPSPIALLQGLLVAVGRLEERVTAMSFVVDGAGS